MLWVSNLDLSQAGLAVRYFEAGQAGGQAVGDRRLQAGGLHNLGNAYRHLGNLRRAIGCHEQALMIAKEIGDRQGEGTSLTGLGTAYEQLGEIQDAISCYEQALVIAKEIGDNRAEGTILGNLGAASGRLGHAKRCISYCERALAIMREIGDRDGESSNLANLGNASVLLGDARRAVSYYEQALAIKRESADPLWRGGYPGQPRERLSAAGRRTRRYRLPRAGALNQSRYQRPLRRGSCLVQPGRRLHTPGGRLAGPYVAMNRR